MRTCETVLAVVQKIKFFTDSVKSKSKFHITLGHQTAIGLVHFFSLPFTEGLEKFIFNKGNLKNQDNDFVFDFTKQYNDEAQILGDELPSQQKKQEEEKKQQIPTSNQEVDETEKIYFAIIQLEK